MLKLRNTAPIVKFRAVLPEWWEPKGQAFIEIDARPAGRINTAFMAARDEINLAHMVNGTVSFTGEDADSIRAAHAFNRDWVDMIYETCVTAWRTNLIDDATGLALQCDQATFVELAGMRVQEISQAFVEFQTAILEAGQKVVAETDATIKN